MFAAMPTPVQIYYGVKKFQEEKEPEAGERNHKMSSYSQRGR